GADVEHAATRPDDFLEHLKTATRRWVEAGSERNARIDRYDDVIGTWLIVEPARTDHQPTANPKGRIVVLPGVCPVLIGNFAGLEVATGPDRARVQERFLDQRRLRHCRFV